MKENPVLNFKINTIAYVGNFMHFINITLIYHITKQRICEIISIVKMPLIYEIWRDTYVNVIVECQRYGKGHIEIRKMKIKDTNIFNTVGFSI
jgi:hypothetical protein